MLRFFMKTVAKDTVRAAAGQLVGTGMLMGISYIPTIGSRMSLYSSTFFSMNPAAEPNSNAATAEPNLNAASVALEPSGP